MEIVKSKENLEHLNRNIKDDFYKVPNLNFDIDKMRADLNVILKKRSLIRLVLKILAQSHLIKSQETNPLRKVIMLEGLTGQSRMKKEKKLRETNL